jgi:predicted translin family RNA/ssDNA-binding protein
MDDYAREIAELQAQVDRLVEAEGDRETIADLETQLEIMRALYGRARELLAVGEDDPELRRALRMRGYGEWTLDNVYAFVYDRAVDLPGGSGRAFLSEIRDADFARLLA